MGAIWPWAAGDTLSSMSRYSHASCSSRNVFAEKVICAQHARESRTQLRSAQTVTDRLQLQNLPFCVGEWPGRQLEKLLPAEPHKHHRAWKACLACDTEALTTRSRDWNSMARAWTSTYAIRWSSTYLDGDIISRAANCPVRISSTLLPNLWKKPN